MAKRKLTATEMSYGIYEPWQKGARTVPQIRQFTDQIPGELGIEFGYVLRLIGGRGQVLNYRIEHPAFKDERGKLVGAFTGTQPITDNDYQFFLGDTLWEPVLPKCGYWTLITSHQGNELHRRRFLIQKPA